MSMTAGTVTVADDGTVSGDGLARAIYDVFILAVPGAGGRWLATTFANPLALALVTYLQGHAVAHITTEVLGRTPNPNNANANIQPPTSPVDVPIK